jgi:deazaflavin-dependent oxidoreductase (nitroreductase family)
MIPIPLPAPHANPFQRLIKILAATRPAAWLLAYLLPRLDTVVLRLSRGRATATSLLSGLPVVLLTTTGARSGQPRTNLLIVVTEGARLICYPTNFGGSRMPGWAYNLRANPHAQVTYREHSAPYRAREAAPAERAHYWALADDIYVGYAAYRRRIQNREIPIFVLEPEGEAMAVRLQPPM